MQRSRFGNEFLVLVNSGAVFLSGEGEADYNIAFKIRGNAHGHFLYTFGLSKLGESGVEGVCVYLSRES